VRRSTLHYEMLQLIILITQFYFNNVEYNVVGFTGATSDINDYIYLKVKGDPFSSNYQQ
jgi:hypothetical protein